MTGRVLYVRGGEVRLVEGWHYTRTWPHEGRGTVDEVGEALGKLLEAAP